MNIEQMLNDCCKRMGNPTCLIHRTIHEFNWFYTSLIFQKDRILKDKFISLKNQEIIDRIRNYHYAENDDDTLKKTVKLFHDYCKEVYDQLDQEYLKELKQRFQEDKDEIEQAIKRKEDKSALKMYIVVRKDLNPSVGKLMIHAGHAITKILHDNKNDKRIDEWIENYHQTKIVVSAQDLDALRTFLVKTLSDQIPGAMVADAGFYELEKDTIVLVALGPLNEAEARWIGLKKLSLFKR